MLENRKKLLNGIYDKPIRDCMLKAMEFIDSDKLEQASKEIYETLAAFNFIMFGFFSDFRVTNVEFKKMGFKIDFPNLLADLAFKIILGGDEQALRLLMSIGSYLKPTTKGQVYSVSKYSFPKFQDRNKAWKHFDDILRIILEYQDRIPRSRWRK